MSNTTFNTYLEHHDNGANKHKWYRVTIESNPSSHEVFTAYGRIRAKGVTKSQGVYGSMNEAISKAITCVNKKENGRDSYTIESQMSVTDLEEINKKAKDKKARDAKASQQKKAMRELHSIIANAKEEATVIVISNRVNGVALGYLNEEEIVPCKFKATNPLSVDFDVFDAVKVVVNAGIYTIKKNIGHYADVKGSIGCPSI